MVSRPLTDIEAIQALREVLQPYQIDVDEFLISDIDSYTDPNLRDLWLFAKELRKTRTMDVA